MYNLTSFLPISNQFCVIAGNSGAGKSSFCKILCEYIIATTKIYYYNPNDSSSDFSLRSKSVHVLKELTFSETWFNTNINTNSVLIFDDFHLDKSLVKDFRRIVNYHCRHKSLTLIIIIHTLFKNNIYNELNSASHFFLLKSEASRQIASRKNVLKPYNTLLSTQFLKQLLYINLIDEYSISFESDIINKTLTPLTMFTHSDVFTVHKKDEPCPDIASKSESDENDNVDIYAHYSHRNKRKIYFILSCFKKNNLFKDDLVTVDNSTSMHIYDILTLFLNPFSKKEFSKQEILFLKKLKSATKLSPLPRSVIPMHLKTYLL